jgi:hypothetical protein
MSKGTTSFTRRGLLTAAAGAAAAAALGGRLVEPARAAAPMLGPSRPNH